MTHYLWVNIRKDRWNDRMIFILDTKYNTNSPLWWTHYIPSLIHSLSVCLVFSSFSPESGFSTGRHKHLPQELILYSLASLNRGRFFQAQCKLRSWICDSCIKFQAMRSISRDLSLWKDRCLDLNGSFCFL